MLTGRPRALAATTLTTLTTLATAVLSVGCSPTTPAQHPVAALPPGAPSTSPGLVATNPGPTRTSARLAPNPGGLSDTQMVGQLFISYVYGSTATTATAAQRAANIGLYGVPTAAEVITRWHLGGVVLIDHNTLDPARPTLSTGNVSNAAQITALTSGLQAAARADTNQPLLIGTDQEGGRVQRITNGVSRQPAQQQLAKLSPTALRCGYFRLGRQLRALGINQDYAPVADVVTTNTGVIGDRSFGPNPQTDATDVTQAVAGLQQAGVLATLKHWPGHGSTSTDSHAALAVIQENATRWRAVDRLPFQTAAPIAAAMMTGHLALPALDPSGLPATLSPTLVNGALRSGLGYRGLVLTDSLYMAPMQHAGTPAQVALRALAAGNDMLLETPDLPAAEQAVLTAVRTSPHSRAIVIGALTRILHAKTQTGQPANSRC